MLTRFSVGAPRGWLVLSVLFALLCTSCADGSNPQHLSDFNAGDNAQAIGHEPVYATVVQTANWSPGHSYFYGDVETNVLNSDSVIARVALTCHGS
jgi:hypothetical protein